MNKLLLTSAFVLMIGCSQAEAADSAKVQERLASAQQAFEQAEAEVARIEESILRSEAHCLVDFLFFVLSF